MFFLFFLNCVTAKLISTGGQHTCTIRSNGIPYCWGANDVGQLGDGTLNDSALPIPINVEATDVSAGLQHTCFVLNNGSVVCTGDNDHGQLGTGDFVNRAIPTLVVGSINITRVVCGHRHTCILGLGLVSCFGENIGGKLAKYSLKGEADVNIPTLTDATSDLVVDLALGAEHTCVLIVDGTVQCSGKNTYHQVDDRQDGETDDTFVMSRDDYEMSNFYFYTWTSPLINSLNSIFVAITAGSKHTCGIVANGQVLCWGANYNAQCGDQTISFNPLIMTVVTLLDSEAISIDAGDLFTCATVIQANVTSVRCWGDNSEGQFGPEIANELINYSILSFGGLNEVKEVSAGVTHACVLFNDYTMKCAGTAVELGDGTMSGFSNVTI